MFPNRGIRGLPLKIDEGITTMGIYCKGSGGIPQERSRHRQAPNDPSGLTYVGFSTHDGFSHREHNDQLSDSSPKTRLL